jgi:hypothetical protein
LNLEIIDFDESLLVNIGPEVEQTNSLQNEAEPPSDDGQSKGDSQVNYFIQNKIQEKFHLENI